MHDFKSLSLNTYMDSCNGMCKRVLKDIKNLPYNDKELLQAYATDLNNGGRDYSAIIELGMLLKELHEQYKK